MYIFAFYASNAMVLTILFATHSPFRETSNISDGSCFTADMAVQNVIGDSFRGATWVAIHNGGGIVRTYTTSAGAVHVFVLANSTCCASNSIWSCEAQITRTIQIGATARA